jgi:hypothetical protein
MLGVTRKHQLGGEAPPKRKPRRYQESDDQRAVVRWLRARNEWLVFRVENAARRTPAQAARDRALGMEPGAPDLLLVCGREIVWLEMKSSSGRLSDEQTRLHEQLRRRDQKVIVGYGADDAIAQLQSFARQRL